MTALMHTVLPDPVEPATKRCGIFVRSATSGRPLDSLPRTMGISAPASAHAFDSSISLRQTGEALAFGTSIPTQPFPGTGARIRTLSALSYHGQILVKVSYFFNFTPAAG